MGMYTELLLKADIKPNVPQEVEDVLQHLFNRADAPVSTPNHEFFDTRRWDFIGKGCSYYHVPWADSKYDGGQIFSRSDLKNYNNEIPLFLDWVRPYLDEERGKCIGYSWYEEEDSPTLVYA